MAASWFVTRGENGTENGTEKAEQTNWKFYFSFMFVVCFPWFKSQTENSFKEKYNNKQQSWAIETSKNKHDCRLWLGFGVCKVDIHLQRNKIHYNNINKNKNWTKKGKNQ